MVWFNGLVIGIRGQSMASISISFSDTSGPSLHCMSSVGGPDLSLMQSGPAGQGPGHHAICDSLYSIY